MHPYTVYGIETKEMRHIPLCLMLIACTLIPFTVLKRCGVENGYTVKEDCMHPYTVYGIETQARIVWTSLAIIACTLIPFTVLKHRNILAGIVCM